MSIENVKKFYEAVFQDKALQQKFIDLSQKYQGQQMDEAKFLSLAEQELLPIAKQSGYDFTMDDLKAFGEEKRQANVNRELSDEEMQAVVGGGSLCCAFIGTGTGNAFCFFVGNAKDGNADVFCIVGGAGAWI